MATTIRESISRVRNVLKAVKEDPFITDRFLHSLIVKYSKTLMKREDNINSIYNYKSLFREIPCVELIDVDKVDACCTGIRTGCTFKRTKEKLPKLSDWNSGPVIKSITSLDYSVAAVETQPTIYTNLTRTSGFKYNKAKYYWYLEGHIYLPNVDWEAIRIQAIFDEDVSTEVCNVDCDEVCISEQDREFAIPEYLFSEIEQMVLQEVLTAGSIPPDGPDDSQNVMR
jgi:hypothetical protein